MDNGGLNSFFLESYCVFTKNQTILLILKQVPSNRIPGRNPWKGDISFRKSIRFGTAFETQVSQDTCSNEISDPKQGNPYAKFQHQLVTLTIKPGALEKRQYVPLESFAHSKISRPQVSDTRVHYSFSHGFCRVPPQLKSPPAAAGTSSLLHRARLWLSNGSASPPPRTRGDL